MNCPVGRNIHSAMNNKLLKIQKSMENEMGKIKVSEIFEDLKKLIEK